MRRCRRACALALVVGSSLAGSLDAQVGFGSDLTLRTRYEWRGLTGANGVVIQQDLFASWGSGPTYLTLGGWDTQLSCL